MLMRDQGYVSEIEYTHGYYSDFAPNRLKFISLLNGVRHSVAEQPSYLELGFGQGLSLNIHAASNPGQYWGADFNAAQATNAQSLAQHGAGNVRALEDSFEELLARPDLPEFDIIALHGLWSWVPGEVRQSIVELAKRHLKPGGLFYVSYNIRAGWASIWPLRDILLEHYRSNPSGSVEQRVKAALEFASDLDDGGAKFFALNPIARERLKQMKAQDMRYLAHEFFNETWEPTTFPSVCSTLAGAKLEFAGSAHLTDALEHIHISSKARAVLQTLPAGAMQGMVKDLLVGQQFRKDVFVKGRRVYTSAERQDLLSATRFILVQDPDRLPKSVRGALGDAVLDRELYQKILRVLEADKNYAKTLGEILHSAECAGMRFGQLEQAMVILLSIGFVELVSSTSIPVGVEEGAQRLNSHLCLRAEYEDEGRFLASPLTGIGVAVSRFEKLFLNAIAHSVDDPATYVWELIEKQGQRLKVNDRTLETRDENIAELRRQFGMFLKNRLPRLERLGLVTQTGETASAVSG
jgi:SAM-dependent methyltransferase